MVGLSLVVTCYNLEKYIEDALRSVFAQDYAGPMEVIIIDDASQDDSVAVIEESIKKYGDGWDVTFIKSEKNTGVSGATDRAWPLAKYDWIIEVDGDDVQYPDRCSTTARLIDKYPDAGAIFMSFSCINSHGVGNYISHVIKGGSLDADFCAVQPKMRADIFTGTAINMPVAKGAYGCSFAINKKIVKLWGPLNDENVKCFAQDPPWEFRAFVACPIVWSNQLACKYRSHNSNILNRERKYGTVADCIENELSMCAYDKKEIQALHRMIEDVSRALVDDTYTDWDKPDLVRSLQMFKKYEYARSLRADWWNYGIFKKIMLILQSRKQMPSGFARCLVTRVLPLRLFAWLKMLKNH